MCMTQNLAEIEQIKHLKARYFRYVDQKRWDEWNTLFTDDVVAVYQGVPGASKSAGLIEASCTGRANLVAAASSSLSKGTSVHHGHMPEIELTSPTTARGTWAMVDYLLFPNFTFKGYGHYDEDYVKEGGQWKIKRILLTRLHCELDWKE